ncbi:MAG: prepilin-type N-terminal cleavage/methylation domain-containing protein [Burkholderiales bacterium]|nr:prepilin-type N-terminal cleavage/methylation domain-containing protein [Burkholderiales bacterium]
MGVLPLLSKEGWPRSGRGGSLLSKERWPRSGRGGSLAAPRGFTLIELLVVMAIIATLLMLVVPRYFSSVDRSKEVVLKQSLATVRDAIDKHYGDTGRYPDSLQDLVDKRYLRSFPVDPVTESALTWRLIPPADATKGGVYDLRSGAPGGTAGGTPYSEL